MNQNSILVFILIIVNCTIINAQKIKLPFNIPVDSVFSISINEKSSLKFDSLGYNQYLIDKKGNKIKHGRWYYTLLHTSADKTHYYLGYYENGKKINKWFRLTLEGDIQYISGIDEYRNDKLNGEIIRLSPNEQVLLKGNYQMNKLEGNVLFYSLKGEHLATYFYVNDTLSTIIYYNNESKDIFLPKKELNYYPIKLLRREGCVFFNSFLYNENEMIYCY